MATYRTSLARFDPQKNIDRGRPRWIEFLWHLTQLVFFRGLAPWPNVIQCGLLRLFGATIGRGVNIKPRVYIHMPWKLEVGDDSWLGDEAMLLNLEPIRIGSNCCISQRAFLCTGNHDYRAEDFAFRNAPIVLEDGVWVGAQSFVGPGVTIAAEAVVRAGSVVVEDLPGNRVCGGNPCRELRVRWPEQ